MPLSLSGLHTKCFRWSATTVGCFGFHEPACGLTMNLLLTVAAAHGDDTAPAASTEPAVFNSGNGVNILEYRAFRGSLTNDCLLIPPPPPSHFETAAAEVEWWSGVIRFDDSGRKVAIETLLLG